MAHYHHIDAAYTGIKKLLLSDEIDRADLAEFLDVMYNESMAMVPIYKAACEYCWVADKTIHIEELSLKVVMQEKHSTMTSEEKLAKIREAVEVEPYYAGHKRIGAPVPEGTLEACDEVLQNKTENEWVAEHANPYKDIYKWSQTDPAIKKHEEWIEALEAEHKTVYGDNS